MGLLETFARTVIVYVILSIQYIVAQSNNLRTITDCICPEDIVLYECTICGGLATVWEGNAFQCLAGEITLTHSDFGTPSAFGECSDALIGRGLSTNNGCYISRLNVTFSTQLQGRTISCSVDDGRIATEIGSVVLNTSTDPFLPPNGVHLDRANSNGLIFSWNETRSCPSLSFNITAINCGNCPNITDTTSVSCLNFTLSHSTTVCNFSLRAVICDDGGAPLNLVGTSSTPVLVNLTVADITNISTTPHYLIDDNSLRRITTTFKPLEQFEIYNGVNGKVTSYTTTYLDSALGTMCGSNVINASSCTGEVCSDEFNISSSKCMASSDINITVFATTNLGETPKSDPIKEEYQNDYLRVEIETDPPQISCTFLNTISNAEKSCNGVITYGRNCELNQNLCGEEAVDRPDVVIISLRNFLMETEPSKYCQLNVNAKIDAKNITILFGTSIAVFSIETNYVGIITGSVVAVIVLSVAVVIFIVTVLVLYIRQRKMHKHLHFFEVTTKCNMVEFAEEKIDYYDPDSGKGYFQLTEAVYTSPKTQVLLVKQTQKKKKIVYAGLVSKAHSYITVDYDDQTCMIEPQASCIVTVFVQSTSRIKMLKEGTTFLYYGELPRKQKTVKPSILESASENLKQVKKKYKTFHVSEDCCVIDLVKKPEDLNAFKSKLAMGYGFYQFTKKEMISRSNQVLLRDKKGELYYGPKAYQIAYGKSNEGEELEPPDFNGTEYSSVFIQTRSRTRVLQAGTDFLCIVIPNDDFRRVTEPFKIFKVPEDASEDERKNLKFTVKNIPCYDPLAGYAYYEFTKRAFILPERNVMALKKNGELFTGPGVRKMVITDEKYDGTEELELPRDLSTDWECIFIQGRAYGRKLLPGTKFLYCEYDYSG